MTIRLDSAFYTDKLNFYYGGSPEDLENLSGHHEALWNRFEDIYEERESVPLDLDAVLDAQTLLELRDEFLRFIQHYALLHIDIDVLESENELPQPGTGLDFYLNHLNAFYGQCREVVKKDLWNNFLLSKGLTTNPQDTPELREAFAQYINGLRMSEVRMEAATTRSPENAKAQLLLNGVMESVGTMLNTVESLIKTQARLLTFYGTWQESYTKMMTRVPNLIPVEDIYQSVHTTVKLPDIGAALKSALEGEDPVTPETIEELKDAIRGWDLQEYTFGYNKINLKEVIEWGIDSALKNPGEWQVFRADKGGHAESGNFQFRAVPDAEGNITKIRLRFYYPEYTDYWTGADLNFQDAQGNVIMGSDSFGNPVPKGFSDWVKEAQTLFKEEIFCNLPDVVEFVRYYTHSFNRDVEGEDVDSLRLALRGRYLLGEYGGDDEELQAISEENFHARAEQNAILQQFVENIRSLRKFIADKSKALQLSLADAKEAVNKITGLWTVILEMINNVTKAIFKEK